MSDEVSHMEQLCFDCARCVLAGGNITLSLPKGEKWPAGFPRGELLSENLEGARNVSFDPVRVLAWAQKAIKAGQVA